MGTERPQRAASTENAVPVLQPEREKRASVCLLSPSPCHCVLLVT